MNEIIASFIKNNGGKLLGGVLGFLVALIFIISGFWKGLFIIICIIVGSYIGSKIEYGDDLHSLLSKFWIGSHD